MLDWAELRVNMAKYYCSRYNGIESLGEMAVRGTRNHPPVREPPSAPGLGPERDASFFSTDHNETSSSWIIVNKDVLKSQEDNLSMSLDKCVTKLQNN